MRLLWTRCGRATPGLCQGIVGGEHPHHDEDDDDDDKLDDDDDKVDGDMGDDDIEIHLDWCQDIERC